MNIPYLLQRFSENRGVFTPYPGGQIQIMEILDGMVRVNGRLKLWILPDGRLINHRLTPYPRYRQVLDYFQHDKSGHVIITGRYPNFLTSTGVQVWLDADGIMKPFNPGPIDDRVQLKNRVAALQRQTRSATAAPKIVECRYCGTEFKRARRTGQFCSTTCRGRWHNAQRIAKRIEP